MDRIRIAGKAAIAAGFVLLFVAPQSQWAQSLVSTTSATTQSNAAAPTLSPGSSRPLIPGPAPQQARRNNMPMHPQRPSPSIGDELSGITLTADQKTKIDEIGRDIKSRIDLVARDDKETSDQKQAMTEGLQRMKLHEIFMVLTQDQRVEFRKKVLAERAAQQSQSKNPQQPVPK